tara:strand:- start:233 stop:1045 length:813 start_codon:yes stop_codon:yes gene_type:complete
MSDTLSIDKITLENRNLEKIELIRRRDDGRWILNDSLIANQSSINLLLKTIKEMRIKQPIARSALQNIIKRMAIQNTRVDIFQQQKTTKTIYVGGETMDQLGTFMMLKGATEPYVIHIPGFNGYLSSRFSCKENLWRSKKIFNNGDKFTYTFDEHKKNTLMLNSLDVDGKAIEYLNQAYCEKIIDEIKNINDIKNRIPFMTIQTVTKRSQVKHFYFIRKKPVNKPKYEQQKYDQERFYIIVDNTLMLVQYKQFESFVSEEAIEDKFFPWK